MEAAKLKGEELSDDDMEQVIGGVDLSAVFKGEVPNAESRDDIVRIMMSLMAPKNKWEYKG